MTTHKATYDLPGIHSTKKHSAPLENSNVNEAGNSEHTFVLSQQEAEAASPDAISVCGEEDPGEGLEFLVADDSEK